MKVRSVLSVGFWAAACVAFQTNPDLDNLCHDNSRNYEFRLLDSVFLTREGLWTSLRIVGTEAAAHSPTSTKEEQDPGSSNSPGEDTSGTQLPQGSTQCDWRKCGTREQVEKTIKEIEEEWGDESAFVTRKLQRRMSTPCRLKKHPCPKQRLTWEREIREEFRRVAPRHLERAATLRKALEQRPPSMSGSLGTQSTGGTLPQATPEDTSVSRMSATPGNAVEVELIGFAVGNDDTDIPVFRTPGPPGTTSAPSEPQAGIPATLGGKPAILILPTTSDASTGGRSISQSGTNLTQQASFQQPGGTASGPSTSSSVSTSQTALPPGNVRGAAGLGTSTPSTTNLHQASSKNSTVDPGASSSSGVSGVAQAFPGVLPGSVMHQALQRSGLLSQPPPSERPAASKRRRKRRGGEGDLASQGVGRTGVNQPVAVDPYDNTPSPKLRFSPLRTAEGAAGATKPPHLLASLPSSDPGMFSSTGSSPTGSSRLPSPQGSSSSTSLSLGTAHRNSQTTFPLKREPLPPGTLVEPVVPLVPFAANKNGRLETVLIPSAAVVATGGSSFPQSGTDATQQVGSQQPRRTASGPPTSSFVSASQTALPPGNVRGAAGPGAPPPPATHPHLAYSKRSTVDPEPSLSRSSRGVPQAFPNLQQQPQGNVVHQPLQQQPQGNVVHQPLQQQPQGSLVHQPLQQQPQGNVVYQPLQLQPQGSVVHQPLQQHPQGSLVHQPLQQHLQGSRVHQPLQQQPQGSVVHQPLQHQAQGSVVHQPLQQQPQGSLVHQPLQQQELLPPGVQPETSVSWKPALASADKGQQRSSGKMLMTLDIPGSSRRASERAYYAPSRDGALLFDQLFPEFPFEGTSMNHPQHYAGHDTANVGDSSQPKTAYSTGEVAGPASSFDFLSPTGWKRTIRSIEAPHPGHGSQQPGGGGTVLPSYPQLKDFDLTLLSTPMPAPQWDTSTNAPSENVAAKTQAVPTRGDESGSVTSPYDQLFREAAAFNESMRSDEAPKSYLTSTSMHFQSAAPSSQNRPGSLQNKPSESGRTSGVSAVGHKAAAPHVKPSDREQNPFQLFVEPLPSAPKPTSAFAWPEAGTSFEPVTSAESMTVSGGSGKKQAKRSTSPVTASLEQSPFETVSVSSATELQAPSISEYGSPRTHLSSTPAVKGPSAGPVSSTSNEFGSLLAAALRDAGWSDGMTEDEATDFVLDSIKNLEELQVANEWDAASTETRPAAEGGTQHASFNLVSTLLGPDATPTPPGSRSTPPGGPTKKPSAMGRQKPSSRSTSDSKVEGRSSTRDSSLVAPSTSIGAAVRERSKTSSPGSSSPQSKQLTEESFSLGTKEDDSASMVEGDESQVQSSKATASATRRRAWQGQRLNIFGIQPETPGTQPVLQFMRESNRGSVSTAKSPDTPVTSAPGGSQGDSGNDGVGLVAGSSVLPSAVQGKSYASISGIPSHRESLSSSIQDVQPGGVRGAGRRTPNVRTPVSASPTTVFPFASEGLLKKTSKRQTPGLEGYTPSAKTRRETGTVLPSSLGEWQGLTLRTPMKSTSPGASEMQPLSSLVASTSRGALQPALPGSMSPSSSARPQSLRAPSRGSSSYSE